MRAGRPRLPSGKSGNRQGLSLPRRDPFDREIVDGLVEQTIEIEFRPQMEKYATEPDCGAIHEHKLARHHHRALLLQGPMNFERLPPAIFGDVCGDNVRDVEDIARV